MGVGVDPVAASGAAHRVGGFRYLRAGDEWQWSEDVAAMHGYEPGTVVPTTELVLSHKHPDDRRFVAQTLEAIRTSGGPFSSRHRIVDTAGVTRSVIVVGQSECDDNGEVIGSSGFYIDVTQTLESTVEETVNEVVAEISRSRGAIEQAKGMLMLVYGISGERAFDILVWCSQQRNVKLRQVAEDLVVRARADFVLPPALCVRASIICCFGPDDAESWTPDFRWRPDFREGRCLWLLLNHRHLAEGPPSRSSA